MKSLIFVLSMFSSMIAFAEPTQWDYYKEKHFKDVHFNMDQDFLAIKSPKRAASGAQVPITIQLKDSENYIEKLEVYIDNNPVPKAVSFKLSEKTQEFILNTRIRMEIDSDIRVIAYDDKGKAHMHISHTRASGGCSAYTPNSIPVGVGRIKTNVKDGDLTVRLKHPNHTGLQRDHDSGGYLPKWIIEDVQIRQNGYIMMDIIPDISISADPFFKLDLPKHLNGNIDIIATDTKGDIFLKHHK